MFFVTLQYLTHNTTHVHDDWMNELLVFFVEFWQLEWSSIPEMAHPQNRRILKSKSLPNTT